MNKKDNQLSITIFIFIICFLILLPSFLLPWSLIDDGITVQNIGHLWKDLIGFNFVGAFKAVWESGIGRFRPAYWVYNLLIYLLGGHHPFVYHVFRFLNFATASSLTYLITQKITKSKLAGIFSFLFFTFSFLGFENWYRLGPQEPLTVLFLSLSFYLLLCKKINLVFWPILVLILLKETNIVILFTLLLLYFLNRKTKILNSLELKSLLIKTSLFFPILGIIFLSFRLTGTYSSNFDLSFITFFNNLSSYWSYIQTYFGYFPFVTLFSYVFLNKKKEEFFWKTFILILSLLFLLVILPWSFPLGRYLLPFIFFFSILSGIELSNLINYLKNHLILKLILILYFVGILIQNGVIMSGTFYDYFQRERVNSRLVSYIASLPKDQKVYLNLIDNDSTIEYYEEIKTHLKMFYSREDVKIIYLKDFYQVRSNDVIVQGYLRPNIKLTGNTILVKKVESKFRTLIVTTPVGLAKRTVRWGLGLLKGERNIPDGIYTFYYGNYYWNIYRIK